MKHPVRSDFHSVVTGVSVTFKPTNGIYCFYRVTDTNDIARLGPVLFAGVQHAGRNTEDYPSDEVQDMAQRIASDFSSVSLTMARAAVAQGVTVMACTPHILPGVYHNYGLDIRAATKLLQDALNREGIALQLVTGADVHMAPNFRHDAGQNISDGETGGSTVWKIRAFGQAKPTPGAPDTRASGTSGSPML